MRHSYLIDCDLWLMFILKISKKGIKSAVPQRSILTLLHFLIYCKIRLVIPPNVLNPAYIFPINWEPKVPSNIPPLSHAYTPLFMSSTCDFLVSKLKNRQGLIFYFIFIFYTASDVCWHHYSFLTNQLLNCNSFSIILSITFPSIFPVGTTFHQMNQ